MAYRSEGPIIDLEFDDCALLALAGFVGALLESSLHDDSGAPDQAFGDVLRGLAPDVAAEEQRFAVLPLVGLTVEGARWMPP